MYVREREEGAGQGQVMFCSLEHLPLPPASSGKSRGLPVTLRSWVFVVFPFFSFMITHYYPGGLFASHPHSR